MFLRWFLTHELLPLKEKCQGYGLDALGNNTTEHYRKRVLWTTMGGQNRRKGNRIFLGYPAQLSFGLLLG